MTNYNTPNDGDFRPLPVGWYTRVILGDDEYAMNPCPGLINRNGRWIPAHPSCVRAGIDSVELFLVYRPDLAYLPGDLVTKVVDGVEFVRPDEPLREVRLIETSRRFPISKMEA